MFSATLDFHPLTGAVLNVDADQQETRTVPKGQGITADILDLDIAKLKTVTVPSGDNRPERREHARPGIEILRRHVMDLVISGIQMPLTGLVKLTQGIHRTPLFSPEPVPIGRWSQRDPAVGIDACNLLIRIRPIPMPVAVEPEILLPGPPGIP